MQKVDLGKTPLENDDLRWHPVAWYEDLIWILISITEQDEQKKQARVSVARTDSLFHKRCSSNTEKSWILDPLSL